MIRLNGKSTWLSIKCFPYYFILINVDHARFTDNRSATYLKMAQKLLSQRPFYSSKSKVSLLSSNFNLSLKFSLFTLKNFNFCCSTFSQQVLNILFRYSFTAPFFRQSKFTIKIIIAPVKFIFIDDDDMVLGIRTSISYLSYETNCVGKGNYW